MSTATTGTEACRRTIAAINPSNGGRIAGAAAGAEPEVELTLAPALVELGAAALPEPALAPALALEDGEDEDDDDDADAEAAAAAAAAAAADLPPPPGLKLKPKIASISTDGRERAVGSCDEEEDACESAPASRHVETHLATSVASETTSMPMLRHCVRRRL